MRTSSFTVTVYALTLQHKLLHLDLVELVGADDDAVAGQVDAAARLQSFNLLGKKHVFNMFI